LLKSCSASSGAIEGAVGGGSAGDFGGSSLGVPGDEITAREVEVIRCEERQRALNEQSINQI
jgi:hypothetical protein